MTTLSTKLSQNSPGILSPASDNSLDYVAHALALAV